MKEERKENFKILRVGFKCGALNFDFALTSNDKGLTKLDLKIQFVPRSKHTPSRLLAPVNTVQ